MRTDPTGKWWQIIVYAVIGGINAQRNGGDFWTGAYVGAVSGALSWGIGEGLGAVGMAEGALSTNIVSGALASGIMSETMGGDFMDGAKEGALSGLISWGVGKYLGKWGDKNQVNKYIVKGLDTELNARARGKRSDPLYLILNAIIFIWDSFKENTFAIKKEDLSQSDNDPAGNINGVKYYTREQWGARDPNRRYKIDTEKTGIVLHQTAGPKGQTVNEIQDYHMDTNGWDDIGYHFLIGPDGKIYEGRPLDVLGAHVLGHNTGHIGISFIGRFSSTKPDKPELTQAQIESGHNLINALKSKYGINDDKLFGHFQLQDNKPYCPGYEITQEFLK